MSIKWCVALTATVLTLTLPTPTAFAQADKGSIQGRVTDSSGKIWDEVWGHTGKA